MAQRLADPAREVDVRGPHDDPPVPFLDLHDPVQRVLGLLVLLLVARERENLVLVARRELARDRQLARRIAIVDPTTGPAELFVRW
jgi:hypothetical protein